LLFSVGASAENTIPALVNQLKDPPWK